MPGSLVCNMTVGKAAALKSERVVRSRAQDHKNGVKEK